VDDPTAYGAIAATNSLSDVYAMGGTPISVLNIVGFTPDTLPLNVLTQMLAGAQAVVAETGAALLGGHTVKAPELFFGLSVTGVIHPDKVITNAGARPGDVLVLTKPIGTGVLTTALKQGELSDERLAHVTGMMRRLNRNASEKMKGLDVHGCTDVTGFGLAGHLQEMAHNSEVEACVYTEKVPLLDGALEHARAGHKPGGLNANRKFLDPRISISDKCDPDKLDLLFDPQTSGGLLLSLPAEHATTYIKEMKAAGEDATLIGEIRDGNGSIQILP
jgi:selenide,water dikinase